MSANKQNRNDSEDLDAKYRAKIEFIEASDWEKDLHACLSEILGDTGSLSRDISNPDSEYNLFHFIFYILERAERLQGDPKGFSTCFEVL